LSGGFLQTRASARTGCPGVAASSRVLHTRQDWPLVPPQCCRLIREVRFASDNLPSSIVARTLRSVGEEGCSPPCLVRGSGANGISRKQCGPGGWPGPHLFCEEKRRWSSSSLFPTHPYSRHILERFFSPSQRVRDSFGLCFVFSSPILITPKNGARIRHAAFATRRPRISDCVGVFQRNTSHPQCAPPL